MLAHADPFRLRIERPKTLTAPQECELVRAAVARRPSMQMKRRLASLLMHADEYSEAIALLEDCVEAAPDFGAFHALAQARLALENEPDTRRAHAAAARAVERAPDEQLRAAALATLGKAQARLGDDAAAQAAFEAALVDNPQDKDACKRLIALHFRRERPEAALVLIDRLMAAGASHARLFAGRTLALARLGRVEDARAFENLAGFSLRRMLAPPAGWASLAAFNAALAEELVQHPALRYERYGTASTKTWRIDAPAASGSGLLAALYDRMQSVIMAFVAELAAVDHPWVRARPDEGVLHNWCVITDGVGHEEWHVHQFGWLSGVYYVAVPEAVSRGDGAAGGIGFGLPEDLVGEQAANAYGLDLVRPQAGLAMLFPSHAYHRTFQHGVPERRICLAFDVWPT